MTQEMIDALYASILTDTGSFRFSNTTPQTHLISADLIRRGARFQEIYQNIYETESKNRTLLKGMLLANMHFESDDRLAWFALTQELAQKTGIELWETEVFRNCREASKRWRSVSCSQKAKTERPRSAFVERQDSHNSLAAAFGRGGQ